MDHRIDPRIFVNHLCHARFKLPSKVCRNVRIANLARSGCCIRIPVSLARELEASPILEDWALGGIGLPDARFQAKVVWVRTRRDARGAVGEAGIRFMAMPMAYHQELDDYIAYIMKTGIPPVDYTGMPA